MDLEYGLKSQLGSLVLGLQRQPTCPESTECAEKVEAMLSTAVLHLADLWNMLTLEFSEGVAFDPDTALLTPVTEIPPIVLSAMKSKLENSLEWCQLARSRLRDIPELNKSSQVSPMNSSPLKRLSSFPPNPRHLDPQLPTTNHNLWEQQSHRPIGFASPLPRHHVGVQNA